MTKIKRPTNKYQRKLIEEKLNEKKRKKEIQRSAKVWRKLNIESLKERETQDELREYTEKLGDTHVSPSL